jgi:hypothetical protein
VFQVFKFQAVCLLLMIALNGNNIAIAAGESDPQFVQYKDRITPERVYVFSPPGIKIRDQDSK